MIREANSSELANMAHWLGPAANRLVFYGIATCRPMFDPHPERVRGDRLTAGNTAAIATVPLDRLAPEVGSHIRTRERQAHGEFWTLPDGTRMPLTSAAQAQDTTDAALFEYATLLTQQTTLSNDHTLRVVSLPVQLSLLWRVHARSGQPFVASGYVEDVVELAASRASLAEDVATLPEELRHILAGDMAKFCASDAAAWVVTRAIQDARGFAGVAAPIIGRLEAVARFAPA